MFYSRRATPRTYTDGGINAFWYCNGEAELSHIQNLNLGGVFIETRLQKALGSPIDLHFLVSEGPIRARAVVRHVEPGHGLGLKLTAMSDQHCLHFGALIKRLYTGRMNATSAGSGASSRLEHPGNQVRLLEQFLLR